MERVRYLAGSLTAEGADAGAHWPDEGFHLMDLAHNIPLWLVVACPAGETPLSMLLRYADHPASRNFLRERFRFFGRDDLVELVPA